MTNSEKVSAFRRNRKKNLIMVCGSRCNLCGYSKSNAALEFHHIDETEKEYGIASNGTCHSLERDLQEVKKCILVCANCHREIHEGFYTKEQLIANKVFDETVVQNLILKKEKTVYTCLKCGKEILTQGKTQMCIDCYNQTQKEGRPLREELKSLIRKYSFRSIGKIYNVSDNAIKKWCKNMNLPHTKQEINSLTDDQWSEI